MYVRQIVSSVWTVLTGCISLLTNYAPLLIFLNDSKHGGDQISKVANYTVHQEATVYSPYAASNELVHEV